MTTLKQTNINKKLADLNAAVDWFYGDDFSLDQATEKYQKAIKMAKDIKKDLEDLKNKIEVVSKDFSKE